MVCIKSTQKSPKYVDIKLNADLLVNSNTSLITLLMWFHLQLLLLVTPSVLPISINRQSCYKSKEISDASVCASVVTQKITEYASVDPKKQYEATSFNPIFIPKKKLMMQVSVPNINFLIQVQIKETTIYLHISQHSKYTWILMIKMIIRHRVLSTRQSMEFTLKKVKYLLMSYFNDVK